MGVEPLIGIRARLLSKGAGKWAESGGENAKFGLSTAELLAATELLRAEKMGHCFKLLHFHIGSQVPDILTVKKAVQEAARFYAKLYKMGFAVEFIDVGGGLGVDYDGSRAARSTARPITRCRNTRTTSFFTSAKFATRRRCRTRTSSAKAGAPLSRITAFWSLKCLAPSKKSGRAKHFNTATRNTRWCGPARHQKEPRQGEQARGFSRRAGTARKTPSKCSRWACWICPTKPKSKSFTGRSAAKWWKVSRARLTCPDEIRKLEDSLGDQFLCNFSVFQSLLDHWALGQFFPDHAGQRA